MPTREEIIAELTSQGQFELTTDEGLGYPIKVYKNAPRSLRELYEQTTPAFDDRIFTIYNDETLTFPEFRAKVASLAHFLAEKGVKKGDRVAVGMRNYPEWIISFWACQAIGAIVVALNAWWITGELEYALEDSDPKVAILDGERWERVAPLMGKFPGLTVVVVRREGAPAGGVDFADAVAKPQAGLPDADIGPLDLATILYTSGTTGRPKGAFANQRNHITNVWNTLLSGQVSRRLLGVPDDFVAPQGGSLQTFPFFHIGGMTGLYLGTIMGSKMALMYKWNPVEAVELIEKYGLTGAGGVPIVVRQLLETATAAGKTLTTLVGLSSGGAPVPPDLIRRVETQFEQKAAPANGYGLTETTSAVIANGGADYFAHPNSVGRPVPTCQIRVVDDNGKDVPQGQIGEIWMRGPNVIPGYWNKPEATEEAFGGGWFRSGDLGYLDNDGFYYVVDRKKDVIIRGGENIYCAEVEAALLEHPMVVDATVIGLPNQEYGEEVAAVIVVDPADRDADIPGILKADLGEKLARFKIPTTFHVTEVELPRTATGKVLKREIRVQFFTEKATA